MEKILMNFGEKPVYIVVSFYYQINFYYHLIPSFGTKSIKFSNLLSKRIISRSKK